MADIKAIRDRLASRMRTVTGINTLDVMPADPVLPAAIVAPPPGDFVSEVTGDGCEDIEMVVTVLVSKTIDENAQNKLDEYISEGSTNLANAIESGSTTDWDYAIASRARNYGVFTFGAGDQARQYLGFEIPVEIGVS